VILKGIDGSINETQKQDLSSIYNSGQHLLRLITDILDLSKLEAGKMELQFADVNLPDMINSVMSTAVGLVKDKSIKLVQIVPENLPIVKADPTRVRQVLLNFLSNAAKFTEQGEITVEAAVREKKGMSEVLVTVKDTGPGIAEKDQAKLFLPFSQVDDSPTRKTGGTGLGLSISRQLIEMHGGKIGLMASEVGKGSTFFFTLPLRTPDAPVVPEQLSNGGNVILAIDDDPEIISLYERYLKPHGYQVVALTDPKRAVERAIQIQPIAITLDVMMPEIDGWHVIQDLKKEQQTRHIPVIMCSILEEEEKGFSMGAADYLVKPFLQEDLINAISRLNHDGKINDILIVGDSEADAQIVKKIVDETGKFSSRLVVGSKLGIEEIRNSCPDAILMDLFLPDTDGFSLLETLRTEKLYNNIPVIILTNSDLTPEQHKMLTDFSIQLLNKSLLREKDLLASIEGALRKFQSKGKLPQTTTRPLG
jgi:CheY-like chemotaxis protein